MLNRVCNPPLLCMLSEASAMQTEHVSHKIKTECFIPYWPRCVISVHYACCLKPQQRKVSAVKAPGFEMCLREAKSVAHDMLHPLAIHLASHETAITNSS